VWWVWGVLCGLAGAVLAMLQIVAPETAVVTDVVGRALSLPAAAVQRDGAAGPVMALLLPLALDRLLQRAAPWLHRVVIAVVALLAGVLTGAVEPALLMGLAVTLARVGGRVAADDRGLGERHVANVAGQTSGEGDGFLTIAADGTILTADARALEMLGGKPVGRPLLRYLPRLAEEVSVDSLLGQRFETELQHESSKFRPVEIDVVGLAEGERAHGRIRLTDISARAERLAELERLALHDALTGLPNRALFHDRVRQSIAAAERHGGCFAVMLLDLDRFKQVNDTLGHQVGDKLLQAAGPRLARALRKSDTLARLGGDEFAVLLPAPVDMERTSTMAERLVESMFLPFVIDGMSLDLGVSVGAALYPDHGADLDTLVHSADVAMYKAKREQLGFSIFNAEQAEGSARRLNLQRDMRPAVDRGEMQVLFQPKVAVAGWAVTGAEALLRWNHPIEGVLTPDDFLAIAEQTGLVMPLTLKVLNDCLEAQRRWRHDGIDLPVSINISAKWLRDREFPKILNLLLRNWQGRPEQLMLEISESAVMVDPQGTLETLDAVAKLGVRITLDHFGTGYSSLPLLQRLPITALKIDRTFVGDLFSERSATVVVRSVVKLAHGLGLRVIASGVESERAADHLAAIGCDEIQGYFVGHPMTADQVPDWLEAQGTRRHAWT
jgi:diguanylate cyclase (GGDEF)-like protein